MLGVRGLARISSTPGRTQQINFFLVNDVLYFVDLPGYGFAKAPSDIKREWGPMIARYLASRTNLVLSILITDSRHGPTRLDLQMREWLKRLERPYIILATKADKLSGNELRTIISRASKSLDSDLIIPYSAVSGVGKDRVWKTIAAHAGAFSSGKAGA